MILIYNFTSWTKGEHFVLHLLLKIMLLEEPRQIKRGSCTSTHMILDDLGISYMYHR